MTSMAEYTVTFDGSFEGFLCIIYSYYYDKISPSHIQIYEDYQPLLDAEEYYIKTDFDYAERVQNAIKQKISNQAFNYLTFAFLSHQEERFMDMFKYIKLGFKVKSAVDNYLKEDYVQNVHNMARYTGKEAHLLCGFCRFAETANKVFYSSITPTNNVLPILAEHFKDRMMYQAWIIHDTKRSQAAVYNGEYYVICNVPKKLEQDFTQKEYQMQALWVDFLEALAIKERTNIKLQNNLLPKHFRKHMVEFG